MTNVERLRESMEAALNTHRVAKLASESTSCECGQKLRPMFYKQQLGYNEEQKCMCDFVSYHCVAHDPSNPQTCQHIKVFAVPLKGKMYDEMAAAMPKEGIVASMRLEEGKS